MTRSRKDCKPLLLDLGPDYPGKQSPPLQPELQFERIHKIFLSNAENVIKAKKQGYKFTSNQLAKWGVKYHKLIFGKPSFDIYVDDKNLGFKKKWIRQLKLKIRK